MLVSSCRCFIWSTQGRELPTRLHLNHEHESNQRYPVRKHVLVCEEHKDSQANKDLLERFKQRFIRSASLPNFARNILSFHTTFSCVSQPTMDGDGDSITDKGLFLLQTVNISKKPLAATFNVQWTTCITL